MKRSVLLSFCLVVMGMLLTAPVSARQIETITIEDFNDPEESQWVVQGSKFVTEGFPQYGHVHSWADGLYRNEPEDTTLRSLGVRAQFDRKGYNYLEFIPVEEDEDGELTAREIEIPGQAKSLTFWAWGSNHDYYIEVQVRDHRGEVHTLKAGDLDYIGWKSLTVQIPTYIPQSVEYVPMHKGLKLVKIVMWTRPQERVSGFELYIDHISVLTDLHEDPYDGEELGDPEQVQELWQDAAGTNF